MIPKIIHCCLFSNDPIPEKLQSYMNSWKEKLHDYEFMLWNFERFDINSSIWVKQAFEKKYAFAADLIRLYAVYNYGGIYLDMDIEVFKPFNNLLDSDIMMGYENDHTKKVEAGCFGAVKKHKFIRQCLDYYHEREFIKTDGFYDTLPLPNIIADIYKSGCFEDIIVYPSDYFTANSFQTGEIKITKNTYCIHHFAGSWLPPVNKRKIERRYKIYSILGESIFTKSFVNIIYVFKHIYEDGLFKTIKLYLKIIKMKNRA